MYIYNLKGRATAMCLALVVYIQKRDGNHHDYRLSKAREIGNNKEHYIKNTNKARYIKRGGAAAMKQ